MRKNSIFAWAFGLLLGTLGSCRPDSSGKETPPAAASTGAALTVTADGAGLHSEPGPQSRQITTMAAGTALQDLGEVSTFTTPVILGEETMDLPWLRVRLESGQEGWVYAGMVGTTAADSAATSALRREKTLLAIFGPESLAGIDAYRQAFATAREAEATAAAYRQGMALRDQLVTRLEKHLENHEGELPDLFWLEQVIPGFAPQLAAEGTAYYLFADYRQWRQIASGTSDRADDDFFALCLDIFPEDSIEYFFPVWTIQTWDYGGHSLLGQGVHRRLLRQLDQTAKRSRLFAPEIDRFKSDILNDILRPHITYWEPRDSILNEVTRIVADSLPLLTPPEQTAISTRLEQFQAAEAYGIKMNQRAGE